MADILNCCLIITTGGTGPAVRDVTPEATADVCEKMMPGFGELMRKVSLEKVPTAILSRQTAGIRGSCLIVNLPGQPKAIPRMSRRRDARHSVLHRSDQRPAPGDQSGSDCRISSKIKVKIWLQQVG
jgi:molybdopterin biosynthesis enzyme MoaB